MVNGMIENVNNYELKNINDKKIRIDNKLIENDGICVVCELKEKLIEKGFGYKYYGLFMDEIVEGKKGLCSGYYFGGNGIKRVGFRNLKSCLKYIKNGNYNKFDNLVIKKVKIRNYNNVILK